jgi:DHA2 family multidrug resistance protein
LFSLYCGAVMRYSALDIGLVFLTAGTVQLVMVPVMGRLAARVDVRWLLAAGIVVTSYGLWQNAHLTDAAGFWDLARPQMVRAAGMSLIFMPISISALSSIPQERLGNATGLFNLTRELGGSLGLAWMGLVVDTGTKVHGAYLAEHLTAYDPAVQERLALFTQGIGSSTFTPANVPEAVLSLKLQVQAMVLSFGDGFVRSAAVFLLGLGLIALLKRAQSSRGRAAAAH